MPSHPDVEYAVDDVEGLEHIFKEFNEAAGFALVLALHGRPVNLDVLIQREAGAQWFGGDDAVEQYRDDPDASVFRRLEIKVNDMGRVA